MCSLSPSHLPSVVVVVVLGSMWHERNGPGTDSGQRVLLLQIDAAAADKAAAAADKAAAAAGKAAAAADKPAASADKPASAAVTSLCCSY